jgi:prepilin-type N-terminal cleavage/methylation domain-containing protein
LVVLPIFREDIVGAMLERLDERECCSDESGFTLIELSIVLVIIGLIVSGVLVGQDLIRAAGIRATVAQVEKFNSAINTFRVRFGEIPGDMLYSTASSFGFPTLARTGASGLGDGNGLLEGGATGSTAMAGENLLFWADLSTQSGSLDSQLIQGKYVGDSGTAVAGVGVSGTGTTALRSYIPEAAIKRGNYFAAISLNSVNFYVLSYFSSTTVSMGGGASPVTMATGVGLSPMDAYNIDQKMDDGRPNGGGVVAMGTATAFTSTTSTLGLINYSVTTTAGTTGYCAVGANTSTGGGNTTTAQLSTDSYNITVALNSPQCALRFRMN